ncbi:MAG: threonine synthase, partial [Vicinamibacterales bacterium]
MANSYFSHLECSSGCGAGPFDPREKIFLCPKCSLPLLARYDLNAARAWKKESLAGRAPNMWRYRELM